MAAQLSPRESLMVAEVIKGTSAVQACVSAGWSPKYAKKSAHLIIKRPHVQAAIAEAQAKLKEQSQITAERLLNMLMNTYDMAMAAKQSTGAARALELVGKLCGLLQDKLKLEVEAKPSLAAAIDAGLRRAGLPPRIPKPMPDLVDITPVSTSHRGDALIEGAK